MRTLFVNPWVHVIVLLALLLGAVFFRFQDYNWTKALSNLAFDRYNVMRPREPGETVVIVDIDDESLLHLGQWPWPRTVVADLVLKLKEMGAKVVAFDGVLAEPDRTSPEALRLNLGENEQAEQFSDFLAQLPAHDQVLADAIKQTGIFVTAFTYGSYQETKSPKIKASIGARKDVKTDFLKNAKPFTTAATFIPILEAASAGNGSFMANPEVDGIIRKTGMIFSDGKDLYPSLSLEAIRVSHGANRPAIKIMRREDLDKQSLSTEYEISVGDYKIPVDSDSLFWVYFRYFDRKKDYISAYKILEDHPEATDRIRDRIIYIGSSAEGLKDVRSTPLNLFIPGVEVHANATEQILQGKFLLRPAILPGVELIFMLSIGLLIIGLSSFIGAVGLAALTMGLVGGISYASWYAFSAYGLLLDPVYPSLTIFILFVMAALLAYVRTEAEKKHVRQAFGLYISPDYMKELTENPESLKLGGEVRDLSVMFTDIRSFTTISERLSPEALIQLMNDFLTPMSSLVMENRGTIDKYMGDAMMAFWNAPLDDPDHARHACLTALQMNGALEPINARLREQAAAKGEEPLVLSAGIGVHSGLASVGNMGSKQRFAYSALGDTVNLASRLEGQTKAYGVSNLISEATQIHVPDLATLELDLLQVKGKTEPVRIFTLVGDAERASQDSFKTWKKIHMEMIAAYRAMDFDTALTRLDQCRKASDGLLDGFYAIFAERIDDLKTNRPSANWDGVYEAKTK